MSTVTVSTKSEPERLIRAVARLTSDELSEFVLRFDDLQLTRMFPVDAQAARITTAHRLPVADRSRVADLLAKNREEGLSEQEEVELDAYMREMDQRLDRAADELLAIARHRQQTKKTQTGT